MDRLTIRCGNCVGAIKPEDMGTQGILRKLAEYEDLEEQGLLLRLPAPLDGVESFSLDGKETWLRLLLNVGDTFWELNNAISEPYIYPRRAHSLQHILYCMDRLGKVTFLTENEAEAALEKIKEGENGLD